MIYIAKIDFITSGVAADWKDDSLRNRNSAIKFHFRQYVLRGGKYRPFHDLFHWGQNEQCEKIVDPIIFDFMHMRRKFSSRIGPNRKFMKLTSLLALFKLH